MQTEENEETRGNDLEPFSEILSRRQEREAGRFSETTNRLPRKETRAEECECKTCGNKFQGEVITYLFMRPPKEYRASECPACRAIREAEERAEEERELETLRAALRKQWIRTCGIPAQFQNVTWEDLDPDYQARAQKLCRQWAEKFDIDAPGESPSLVLFSPGPGVGKTLLCSLVGTHVINNWKGDPSIARCPINFESGPGLVKRIRATFNLPEEAHYHEREEDVYRELRGVKLLILDDVGKEQPRSYRFTQELYWYLIAERVNAGLPVVINSRLPLLGQGSLEDLMGKDTVDRLYGMCRGKVVALKGESYRKLKKVP